MDALHSALQALEAGRSAEALELVAAAWQQTRSPSLAEAAVVLAARHPTPLSKQLGAVVGRSAAASLERLIELRGVDHPLVANFVLEQLLAPRFVGTTASGFLLELINLGLQLRDVRLKQNAWRISTVLEERMTERQSMELVATLVNGLPAAAPTVPNEAVLELEARLTAALARSVDALGLLRDVYQHPGDDARRLVLADLLLERGDARGEFIQLQCRGQNPERQQALLRKHARQWLGSLATVVRWNKNAATRFERGFLTVVELTHASRWHLQSIVNDPAWATVEKIVFGVPDALLYDAPLAGLREVELFDAMARRLVASGRQFPSVETLTLDFADPDWATTARAVEQLCPRLRVLRVKPYDGVDALLAVRAGAGAIEKLVIARIWPEPEGDEAFERLIDEVQHAPVLVPELELERRTDHRPANVRVRFRAVEGRYLRVADAEAAR